MPYNAGITRNNPALLFIIIDQSVGMQSILPGSNYPKSTMLSTVINRMINDLTIRCSKGEDFYDYFHIGLIGYGSHTGSLWKGILADRDIIPISEVAENPIWIEQRTKKVDDGNGGLVDVKIDFPIWVDAAAEGPSKMKEAFHIAYDHVSTWIQQHKSAFPPLILHIAGPSRPTTDLRAALTRIRQLSTDDGNVLLMNLLVSDEYDQQNIYPNDPSTLEGNYDRLLFETSSRLPDKWFAIAVESMGMGIEPGARMFVSNADITAIIRFLEIGTRQPVGSTDSSKDSMADSISEHAIVSLKGLKGASDYRLIAKNLQSFVLPAHLKEYDPIIGKRGFPIMYPGSYAVAIPIRHRENGKQLALRIFYGYRLIDDMEQRYKAITAFIKRHFYTGIFTNVEYIASGLRLHGQHYPVCVMDWVDGDTLSRYISKNLGNFEKIRELPDKFRHLINTMQMINCAHSHLAADNFIVDTEDKLILIDYNTFAKIQDGRKMAILAKI